MIVKAPAYPYVVSLHGGSLAIALKLAVPAPFPYEEALLVPYNDGGSHATQGLIAELPVGELGPGVRSSLIELAVTLGANLGAPGHTTPLITMPASCPKAGFAWSADLSWWEGPETTASATSPCPGKAASASSRPSAAVAQTPKTQFQCEKAFHTSSGRSQCFNQLPGASCAHPLEAQKAAQTTRGESQYFKLTYREETKGRGTPQYGGEEYYSYAPKQNVRMCPYPIGVVYKVSLLYVTLPNGEIRTREHDTHTLPEPVTPSGGHFHYYLTAVPIKSAYLVVKGYFIHPPWVGRGRVD
jgi:hypothetical protein